MKLVLKFGGTSVGSIERIKKNRDFLERKLNSIDQVFYGINTGFGSLCDTRISENDLQKL